MPLPAWMAGHRPKPSSDGNTKLDMWDGKPLPQRNVTHTNINYRLYDGRTGELLSFNSTNSIDCVVTDVLRTQQEHPNARIVAVEYDGPAFPT
jgi:hypothetical protein